MVILYYMQICVEIDQLIMKYRTRSTARVCDQENSGNEEEVESTTKMRMDPTDLKLFVRQDIEISSMFQKEIVGESGIKFVLNKGESVEVSR